MGICGGQGLLWGLRGKVAGLSLGRGGEWQNSLGIAISLAIATPAAVSFTTIKAGKLPAAVNSPQMWQ
jgi:hypothetical protein